MGIMDLFDKMKQKEDAIAAAGAPVSGVGAPTWLVVGLGNPDDKYHKTRHNAGFMAVDVIAKELGVSGAWGSKFQSQVAMVTITVHKCLLMKPFTYMNRSGQAVTEAMRFYKIQPAHVLVLFDDISLPVGRLRIRRTGSHGGHNGMKNIIYLSGQEEFLRIKIGVGEKPHTDFSLADWVLSRFSAEEQQALFPALQNCVTATELLVCGEIDEAMNRFNGAGK